MRLFPLLLASSLAGAARLFDYGPLEGDQLFPFSTGWHAVTLQVPNVYLERREDDLFISPRGIVSFQEIITDEVHELDKLNRSAIAVFYSPAASSQTYFRSTSRDDRLLRRLSDLIRHEFADAAGFSTAQATLITWENMQSYDIPGHNTFQLVLATDGVSTYSLLLFSSLEWSSSRGRFAESAFTHYDGRFQATINSGTEEAIQLKHLSNIGQDGVFLFRVSGPSIEDPSERDYNYNEDYEEEEANRVDNSNCPKNPFGKDCPQACQAVTDDNGCTLCICTHGKGHHEPREVVAAPEEEKQFNEIGEIISEEEEQKNMKGEPSEQRMCGNDICSAQATCNLHCCACSSGFFGNGVECLRNDEPQRITGGFHGHINGQEIEKTQLHTFATTSDGKAYTAVSQIPAALGHSMLLLAPIGSAMGWLFADTSLFPATRNGFSLTGGLFNRTATVHIGDSYSVSMQQTFSGRDIYHYLKANVAVNGNLPVLSSDARVTFPEYETEYRIQRKGVVSAVSTFEITISDGGSERRMRMLVEENIHFKECDYRQEEATPSAAFYLNIKRTHVTFDAHDGVARYAAEYSTAPFRSANSHGHHVAGESHKQEKPLPLEEDRNTRVDPCAPGAHKCSLPHMLCRPSDQKYRCECQKGFEAMRDDGSPMGWVCHDLDECTRGDHNCDAYATCTNTVGSFSCECRSGFNGDGHRCFNEEEAAEWAGPPRMHAAPSLPFDALPAGHCSEHRQCHQYGECSFRPGKSFGICKCRGWYVGNGVTHCGPPEESLPALPVEEEEGRRRHAQHSPHHHGHHALPGVRPCGASICDPNAECMPSPDGGSECVCRSGFHGNGISCESLTKTESEETEQLGINYMVCHSHGECSEHGSCVYSRKLGGHICECTPPYRGDGLSCTREQDSQGGLALAGCDVTNDCSPDADCVFERTQSGDGTYRCVCRSGFYGDGWRCTMVDYSGGNLPLPPVLASPGCDKSRNCHSDAQCVYSDSAEKYVCECRPGFLGDGLSCHKTAQPQAPETKRHACRDSSDCHSSGHCIIDDAGSGEYVCECLPGFRGDGRTRCDVADHCNSADPSGCRQNAECAFDSFQRAFLCRCVKGFTGDGFTCIPHAPPSDCSQNPRLCHANAQCIARGEGHVCLCRPGSVGDGINECTPHERPHCSNCSMHGHCEESSTTGGAKCVCNVGYQGNGHICAPLNSCLDDASVCDPKAECVPGENGHYVCNCVYGYHGNGRSCTPDTSRGRDQLLVARGMAIFDRGAHADVPGKQLIVIPHHIAVGIDFDCIDERIIWSDISGHSIRSAFLNGSYMKSAFSDQLESPEGIAIDWSSRNIYYADSSKDEIGVLSIDGKYKKALLTDGLVNPRALAIDLHNRHLFYTDWHRSHPVIGRMDLDGKNVMQFVKSGLHLPNGLTILSERRELCWVDAGMHSLNCIGLDGLNRRTVFSDLQYPFGLTNMNEQKFYWTDWKDNRIHTVSVHGEAYESFPISLGGSGKAYGILHVPHQCRGPATSCSLNNGGCKYLCLPGDDGVHCACSDNRKGSDGC